jgi:beta-glucosidase
VTADGGWESEKTVDRFLRFCERSTNHLGDLIAIGCTLNEPQIPALLALTGVLPRQGIKQLAPFTEEAARRCGSDLEKFSAFFFADPFKTRDIMLDAHVRASGVIRGARGDFPVGVTLAMQDLTAEPGGEEKLAEARAECFDPFLEAARSDDFVGVQTYSRGRFGPDGALPAEDGVPVLIMGYEFWPQALEGTIRYAAAKAQVPIYVTENGIGTDDDGQRIDYYREALGALGRCLQDGIDVRGYYAWSLLDNFEWMQGYGPRFGIVSVDRETQARTAKRSARLLGEVARANRFEPDDFTRS